jgi:hypothetical protein
MRISSNGKRLLKNHKRCHGHVSWGVTLRANKSEFRFEKPQAYAAEERATVTVPARLGGEVIRGH